MNPLRGLAADSAYVARAIEQTPGPVLAVGHSYGGAVITNAAAKANNVVGLAAWKTLPSWAVVPPGDKATGSDVVRFMAELAGATSVEVEGSHAIMMSQPQAVTDLILQAIDVVRRRPVSGVGRVGQTTSSTPESDALDDRNNRQRLIGAEVHACQSEEWPQCAENSAPDRGTAVSSRRKRTKAVRSGVGS